MKIAVAGHIRLDIIPTFKQEVDNIGKLLVPGTLVEMCGTVLATGGAVSNTGIALHKLGLPTLLMAKIGDDDFGKTILNIFRQQGESLADGMIVGSGEETSYSIVINPPGIDRIFPVPTILSETMTLTRKNSLALICSTSAIRR